MKAIFQNPAPPWSIISRLKLLSCGFLSGRDINAGVTHMYVCLIKKMNACCDMEMTQTESIITGDCAKRIFSRKCFHIFVLFLVSPSSVLSSVPSSSHDKEILKSALYRITVLIARSFFDTLA